jgi:hypothetical protein
MATTGCGVCYFLANGMSNALGACYVVDFDFRSGYISRHPFIRGRSLLPDIYRIVQARLCMNQSTAAGVSVAAG